MSTTLSMTSMVTLLQRKTGLGLAQADCVDRLNEAFRKINQMSKGGFIWQLKTGNAALGAGLLTFTLPSDFDPGKQAVLYGPTLPATTSTVIPYLPVKDFVNANHYQTTQPGFFSAWTFYPTFTIPTSYLWLGQIGPPGAAIASPTALPLYYHAVNFAPVAYGAANYFPTPDQFDSMIVDLAWAEVASIYRQSDAEQIRQRAMQGIMEIIDTYRTDRYDLAGITDEIAQKQEKGAEGAK